MHAPQSDVADQDRAIKQPAAIADGAEIAFSAGNKAIIRLVIVDTGYQPDSGRAGSRRLQAIGLVLIHIVHFDSLVSEIGTGPRFPGLGTTRRPGASIPIFHDTYTLTKQQRP